MGCSWSSDNKPVDALSRSVGCSWSAGALGVGPPSSEDGSTAYWGVHNSYRAMLRPDEFPPRLSIGSSAARGGGTPAHLGGLGLPFQGFDHRGGASFESVTCLDKLKSTTSGWDGPRWCPRFDDPKGPPARPQGDPKGPPKSPAPARRGRGFLGAGAGGVSFQPRGPVCGTRDSARCRARNSPRPSPWACPLLGGKHQGEVTLVSGTFRVPPPTL